MWNNLPVNLQNSGRKDQFKKEMKDRLINI